MMHTGPVRGKYTTEWKSIGLTKTGSPCLKCGSHNIWYRLWESDCGGYEDVQYKCRDCNYGWWYESDDG